MRVWRKTFDIDRLRELLDYDPETGIFRWKIRKSRAAPGARAGRTANGYVLLCLDQTEIQAHRAAWAYMTGSWPEDQIDHIDRDRANNRFKNLRAATNKQNHENLPIVSTNTSGVPGVRWDSSRSKWFAFITHHQIMKNLGRYSDLTDAVAARRRAEREIFTHAPSR